MKQLLTNVMQEDSGQDLIEYALVAALIGLGAVAGLKTLATDIPPAFGTVATTLTTNL